MILFEYLVLMASLIACALGIPKSWGLISIKSSMVVCEEFEFFKTAVVVSRKGLQE